MAEMFRLAQVKRSEAVHAVHMFKAWEGSFRAALQIILCTLVRGLAPLLMVFSSASGVEPVHDSWIMVCT